MTTRKKPVVEEEEIRTVTYLIETGGPHQYGPRTGGSSFQIQIPEDWEITFSYVNPGEAKGSHCVRVYEPGKHGRAKKLRAVYSDVVQMRDLDIPQAVKVVETASESSYKQDSRGNFKHEMERKVLDAVWRTDDEVVIHPDDDDDDDEEKF